VKAMSERTPPERGAGKTRPFPSLKLRASSRIARALRERGTRWSFPAFILSPGTVQVASPRFTSSQVIPRTSPERQAVSASIWKASFTGMLAVDSRIVWRADGRSL
jgi:hypothetical protein